MFITNVHLKRTLKRLKHKTRDANTRQNKRDTTKQNRAINKTRLGKITQDKTNQ